MNLYRHDVATRGLRQLTHHQGADVRHPSLSGGRIAYELDGSVHLLDLATGRDDALRITIEDALPERAVRDAAIAPYIDSFDVAPDGTRALISGRGELFEAARDGRPPIDRTATSGVREHGGVYAPDGGRITFVSDRRSAARRSDRGDPGAAASARSLTPGQPGRAAAPMGARRATDRRRGTDRRAAIPTVTADVLLGCAEATVGCRWRPRDPPRARIPDPWQHARAR